MRKYRRRTNPERPPAKWWSMTWTRTAASYPRKAKETLEHWRADISRIVGGIWWKFPEETRQRLIKRYERMATPSTALVNVAGAKMLKCPACGNPTLVGWTSVYTRCSTCGAPLRHVVVKRRK